MSIIKAKKQFLAQGLRNGEKYAGLILGKDGSPDHHLILLAGQLSDTTWQHAVTWAESQGGSLPDLRELALLSANLKDEFESREYWSADEDEVQSIACLAWLQDFDSGCQPLTSKSNKMPARAIRRVPVQSVDEQRAPAAGDALHDPALQKLFGEAITGALGFGAQGVNAPPEGHWLEPFWQTARADAIAAGDEHAARDAAFEAVCKRLCALPRYSFLVGPNGEGVQRVKDRSGNWIEFDAAHALFDPVVVDATTAAQQGEGGAA